MPGRKSVQSYFSETTLYTRSARWDTSRAPSSRRVLRQCLCTILELANKSQANRWSPQNIVWTLVRTNKGTAIYIANLHDGVGITRGQGLRRDCFHQASQLLNAAFVGRHGDAKRGSRSSPERVQRVYRRNQRGVRTIALHQCSESACIRLDFKGYLMGWCRGFSSSRESNE